MGARHRQADRRHVLSRRLTETPAQRREERENRLVFRFSFAYNGRMVDARSESDESQMKGTAVDRGAQQTPTLATAPEGLSARRVERWLDLPPGAWQRRRLYALAVKGSAFAALGFRRGDYVIVEPGARQQPGTLVVTRSLRGEALKKVAAHAVRPPARERRMPTVLELPLRDRGPDVSEHVVGTVIGWLRPTGTGALRPLPLQTKHRNRALPGSRRDEQPARAASADISCDVVERFHREWQHWLTSARRSECATADALERWDRLDGSLVALCECLSRSHNSELRSALLAEAATVVRAIRDEMRRYSNYLALQ